MDKRITRIDLTIIPGEAISVRKYAEGWTASTPPMSREFNKTMDFNKMVEWLEKNNWTVFTWTAEHRVKISAGARAFWGKPLPVRTRYQILELREYLNTQSELFYTSNPDKKLNVQIHSLNLAYALAT